MSTTVRRIGVQERRHRLGLRHRLAAGRQTDDSADGVVEAAASVVALHATDPASVFLSVMARSDGGIVSIERALYDDRTLVRMLGMRRTVWAVPRDLAPVVQAAAALAIAAVQRRRLVQHLTQAGVAADVETWLADVERSTLAALVARGEATAVELVGDEPRLRTRIVAPPETVGMNATSRVLFQLSVDGHIVRGRPLGSWTSSQYRWAPTGWLPGGLDHLDPAVARVELSRRWLVAFGPAPIPDLKWWTGWTLGQTRAALRALDAAAVDLDGTPGVALPGDLDPVADPGPWVALLPALDPTPMGWQERAWFLDEHRAALFDRTGNIGPTIWCDGRIVGGWAHRADATIALRLLTDVGAEAQAAVHAAAERLAGRVGPRAGQPGVRITPRFRTPLERELSG
ncbi:MAG: winged helix DNA-binding domain-containing protein [Pseudonocardia sp.]